MMTSGMHHRPFEGRHLVYFALNGSYMFKIKINVAVFRNYKFVTCDKVQFAEV